MSSGPHDLNLNSSIFSGTEEDHHTGIIKARWVNPTMKTPQAMETQNKIRFSAIETLKNSDMKTTHMHIKGGNN